uniref:Uncharacterized protein n=1 Tax=Arundo donax TaxID=35708 RepID=A0A0A9BXU8_ARUDO
MPICVDRIRRCCSTSDARLFLIGVIKPVPALQGTMTLLATAPYHLLTFAGAS